MSKKWLTTFVVLFAASCAGGSEIPDNIPPAPPAPRVEVHAPQPETAQEAPVEEGFGTSAFDTAAVPTAPDAPAAAAADREAAEEEAEPEATDGKEKKEADAPKGETGVEPVAPEATPEPGAEPE